MGKAVLSALLVASLLVAPSAHASECLSDPFTEELASEITTRWPANRITAEVEDLATGCRYSYARENRQSTASVIKISIMAATLLRAQDEGRPLTEWERDQITPMIRQSDDPTASRLWVSLGGAAGMQGYLDRFGLEETTPVSPKWGASITSASDQVDLIKQLIIGGGPLAADGRSEARTFLLDVLPEQQWGATAGVPDGWHVPMKNGFYPSAGWAWRINTVGLVESSDGPRWSVAVLTDGWPDDQPGIEATEFVARAVSYNMLRGEPADHPFVDIPEGAYYEDSAATLNAAGVIRGTSPVLFSPAAQVTRAQLALMLWRTAGRPVPTDALTFTDVDPVVEAAEAIRWMAQEGITTGVTATLFAPWKTVTRAQASSFLHRFSGSPAAGWEMAFIDVASGDYFAEAVAWMVGHGITQGTSDTTFSPYRPLTRAQAVALLGRMQMAFSEGPPAPH